MNSNFNTSIGYGAFQVADTGQGITLFSFNNHSSTNPDIGFGPNISSNSYYRPGSNEDWTFSGNSGTINWKLQILIGNST
jgi:hypothetical protein